MGRVVADVDDDKDMMSTHTMSHSVITIDESGHTINREEEAAAGGSSSGASARDYYYSEESGRHKGDYKGIWIEDVFDCVRFLSQQLKAEFVYTPASKIQDNFDSTIQYMVNRGILQVESGFVLINDKYVVKYVVN